MSPYPTGWQNSDQEKRKQVFHLASSGKRPKLVFIWLCQVFIAAHGVFPIFIRPWDLVGHGNSSVSGMWDLVPWPGMEPKRKKAPSRVQLLRSHGL